MAVITDYASLKGELTDLLHRSDVTAKLAGWIQMAESKFIRTLDIRLREVTAQIATVYAQDYAALPSDFSAPIDLFIDYGSGKVEIPKVDYVDLDFSVAKSSPQAWAIDGANIRFGAPLDNAWPMYLRYQQSFALSDTNTTNWLLTNHPDCYLYGAALQGAPWAHTSMDAVSVWKAYYEDAIQEVLQLEARSLGSTLAIDPGLTGRPVGKKERIFG